MSNVISFPRGKREAPPQSLEELYGKIEATKMEHVENILDEMIPWTLRAFQEEGFDMFNDESEGNINFMVEAIRAALYKSVKIEHPMQASIEEWYKMWTEDEVKETEE